MSVLFLGRLGLGLGLGVGSGLEAQGGGTLADMDKGTLGGVFIQDIDFND